MNGTSGKDQTPYNPFNDREFGYLFENLYVPLCRFALKFVIDPIAAEDIVQEQFVYLWEHRKQIKKKEGAKSYLYKAVRNRSLTHLKSKYSRYIHHKEIDLPALNVVSDLPDPGDLLENKELGALLEEALEALPEKCRTIFTLKKFGELSNREIAEQLTISVKTVEAQMTIAFKKLIQFISPRWTFLLLFYAGMLIFIC